MKKPFKTSTKKKLDKAMVKKKRKPTKQQKKAILSKSKITLVIAGPGTGKTFTLVHRVKSIHDLGVSGRRILIITFTNKAACEMADRLKLLCPELELPWLGTSHGVCCRILEAEGVKFTICDEHEQRKITKAISEEVGLKDAYDAESYITLSKAYYFDKNADHAKFPEKDLPLLQIIYRKYRKKLKMLGKVDFADLLIKTIKLLENNPDILRRYQKKFQHMIADEVQDFTPLQFKLMRLLKDNKNYQWLVGDINQAIYQWLGANPELIINLSKEAGVKTIPLNKNFRSVETIVQASASLISYNDLRIPSNIIATRGIGRKIELHPSDNAADLAKSILENIVHLIKENGYSASDIAIIGRRRICWRNLHRVLLENGINCVTDNDENPYDSKDVQAIVNYLKFINKSSDNEALEAIINYPRRSIGDQTIDIIKSLSEKSGCSYYKAIQILIKRGVARNSLIDFNDLITRLQRLFRKTTPLLLSKAIIKECGFDLDSLKPLLEFIKKYPNVKSFLHDFRPYNHQYCNTHQQHKAVQLMTIHGAKGREFKAVFLVGWEHGVLPDERALKNVAYIEDERRLGYVAVTRAKNRLYIYCIKDSTDFTQLRESYPSQFISEIPNHLIKVVGTDEKLLIPVSERDNSSISDFQINETVVSKKFNFGRIKSIHNGYARVHFSRNIGVKKVLLTKLEKINFG